MKDQTIDLARSHLAAHGAQETALAALLHISHDALRRVEVSTSSDLTTLHKLIDDCANVYACSTGLRPSDVNAAYYDLLRIAGSQQSAGISPPVKVTH